LRWSDRRDDFRTEVLGLVKAQQVKNAVIVPVGSKGGFFPKLLPKAGAPDAVRAEGISAYRTFLSGLLDKSLLRRDDAGRYDLHELVRQYAAGRLAESGDLPAARRAFLDYYVTFAEQAEGQFTGPEQAQWLAASRSVGASSRGPPHRQDARRRPPGTVRSEPL
jgi:hypothetical protein